MGRWWSALRGRRGRLISSKGSRPFLGILCALSGTLAVLRHHDNVLWLKKTAAMCGNATHGSTSRRSTGDPVKTVRGLWVIIITS